VRSAAAQAVGGLGGAAVTPEILARLAELLHDQNRYVRRVASTELGELGYSGFRVFRRRWLFWSRFKSRSVAELAFGTSRGVPPSSNGRPAGPTLPVAAPALPSRR
jgi:hypothetical protein